MDEIKNLENFTWKLKGLLNTSKNEIANTWSFNVLMKKNSSSVITGIYILRIVNEETINISLFLINRDLPNRSSFWESSLCYTDIKSHIEDEIGAHGMDLVQFATYFVESLQLGPSIQNENDGVLFSSDNCPENIVLIHQYKLGGDTMSGSFKFPLIQAYISDRLFQSMYSLVSKDVWPNIEEENEIEKTLQHEIDTDIDITIPTTNGNTNELIGGTNPKPATTAGKVPQAKIKRPNANAHAALLNPNKRKR